MVFRGWLFDAPDVVAGEVHMLPAEGGEVSEKPVRDLLGLAQGGNGAIEVSRVPHDDCGDQEVQARNAVLLVLVGAVADLTKAMNSARSMPSSCGGRLANTNGSRVTSWRLGVGCGHSSAAIQTYSPIGL